jgi:hypothetical protein
LWNRVRDRLGCRAPAEAPDWETITASQYTQRSAAAAATTTTTIDDDHPA